MGDGSGKDNVCAEKIHKKTCYVESDEEKMFLHT